MLDMINEMAVANLGPEKAAIEIGKQRAAYQAMMAQQAKELQRDAVQRVQEQISAARRANDELKISVMRGTSKAVSGIAQNPAMRAASQNIASIDKKASQLGVDLKAEQQNLSDLTKKLEDKKNEAVFANPVVQYLLGDKMVAGTENETIAKKLLGASKDQVDQLMTTFSGDKKTQEAVRRTFLTELFRSSWDDSRNMIAPEKLRAQTDASKFAAFFQDPKQATAYTDFIKGLDQLQQATDANKQIAQGGLKKAIGGSAMLFGGSTALGFFTHIPGLKQAAKAIEYGTLLHIPFNEGLWNYIASNKDFSSQWLKWAQKGGSADALRNYPLVSNMFRELGQKWHDAAYDPQQ